MLFLFLQCRISEKVNMTVYAGSTKWRRKQILNTAKCNWKAGFEMAQRFDKLAIIIVEEMNLFHKQMSVFLRLVCSQNSHGVNFILEQSPRGPSSITPTTPHSLSISR